MLRRNLQITNQRVAPTFGTAVRSYTDYHHHKYACLNNVAYGTVGVLVVLWLGSLSCGSMWWASNREYKGNVTKGWKRQMGTGYKWSDEFGPKIETIFKDLPDRAE